MRVDLRFGSSLLAMSLATACAATQHDAARLPTHDTGSVVASLAPAVVAAWRDAPEWPDISAPAGSIGGGERDAAVIIGIETYANLLPIPGADANAKDWHKFLVDSYKVPVGNVTYLPSKLATREQILRAAKTAAEQVQPGGKVWFIFIGHGAPSANGQHGLLVGYDAVQSAQSLQDRAVSQAEVLSTLEASQGTPVMVLDACFSGRDSQGNAVVEGLQPSKVVGVAGGRGVVMTAAQADEFAGPLPGAERPAFSYLMLGAVRGWADGNNDGNVSASEAYAYVNEAIQAVVKDRQQTPQLDGAAAALVLSKGVESGPDLGALSRSADAPPRDRVDRPRREKQDPAAKLDAKLHKRYLKADLRAKRHGEDTRAFLQKRSKVNGGLIGGLAVPAGAGTLVGGLLFAIDGANGDLSRQEAGAAAGLLAVGLGCTAAIIGHVVARKRNRSVLHYMNTMEADGKRARLAPSVGGLAIRF